MTTDIRLSFSGWSTYNQCAHKWKLHYVDRIRPTGDSSPLLFGSAIDEALNALLLNPDTDAVKVFQSHFTWDMCKDVTWMDADLDWDLFTREQRIKLEEEPNEYCAWASMRIKGRLMIEAYIREALPRITEVHSVQLETKPRPGFIDAVLTIDGNHKFIVDHKTTARPYKGDSVTLSPQLALYAGQTGISRAAFITLVKTIKKNKVKICTKCGHQATGAHKTCDNLDNGIRCHGTWNVSMDPEAICQVITDTISKKDQELMSESLDETILLIKSGQFPKNLLSCNKMFGKKCPYFNYCRTKNMTGLVKKETK